MMRDDGYVNRENKNHSSCSCTYS